ncbi:hypothetical protein [Pandoraea pulmonicola]|uniref:Uncharacterized protein n=1 Tax=Pandoraea pulmonicola TaxID=93221 RepID=A0AAJ4ZBR3_PANPU|nr:hypothetical protein [Pandoraea pulmonicola]AJC20914.1 hypothetical protein RO07_11295 [Pandoraea pulmonicola]SUA90509.1 Uncharacterised protein [Pandoraea pulmonicola]
MMTALRPGWFWYSRRGTMTSQNRDACGVFSAQDYTLAVVMDATRHGSRAMEFNHAWLAGIGDSLSGAAPTAEEIVSAMKRAHRQLDIRRFLHERACYAALSMNHATRRIDMLTWGDCRIGRRCLANEIEWLTRPHTLAHSGLFDGSENVVIARHVATRFLRAKRRFEAPNAISISDSTDAEWILATDGHWTADGTCAAGSEDDCSYLSLTTGSDVRVDTDCENYICRDY